MKILPCGLSLSQLCNFIFSRLISQTHYAPSALSLNASCRLRCITSDTIRPPPLYPSIPHPHRHCLTKCRVYPWLSLSKSTGALWKLFCRLRSWGSILWALQSHSFLRQHCGLQYVAADSLHRTHAHYMLSCRFRVFAHMSGTVPKECKDMECHRCT